MLKENPRHPSLELQKVGEWWRVLNRDDQFWGLPVESVGNAPVEVPPEYSSVLFELLRTERDRIAETEGILPYEVFHDKALQEMATYFPTSEEYFRQMPGVGPTKSEKYAEVFLPIIRDYCKEHCIG